ncbi:hypothetical protein QOZ80_9BG0717180 [Eleusine coracana subsp. coracana]|nr:hypothetical protein QOZ80_9BG0717180 [Eleusine coracana subsp. coracana]
MAAAADRISDLPDDLLRRVLYFASAKEGASTAVLSRRWRSLWHTCGAVNLDTRSYDRTHGPLLHDDPNKREVFLQGAMAALTVAAAHGPVKRISFHIESLNEYSIGRFVTYRHGQSETEHNLIGKVMSNPAARNVEEVHIAGNVASNNTGDYNDNGGYYKLRSCDDLPYKALRVLHIINAEVQVDRSGTSFPLLNSLSQVSYFVRGPPEHDPWRAATHHRSPRVYQYSLCIQ